MYWSTVVYVLCAGVLSVLLTFVQVKYSHRLKLTAFPRSDRWHRNPTPTSGGIAIFLSCAVVYLVWFRGRYATVALGVLGVWLLGLVDDRVRLRAVVKLGGQVLMAALVVGTGVVFPATPWHFANIVFSFLWIVGITNAFNLIDNMDGLCAGVTVIICVFRYWLLATSGYMVDANLCAIVAASFAGFLLFNYKPAKIFMGDSGSMLAGFALSALTIASPLAHTTVVLGAVFYPVLIFIYPIFDTVLVFILRKTAGRPVSAGGRDHSSHRLASLGLEERNVVWILWILTAFGSALSLMVHWMPREVVAFAAFLIAALTMFGCFLATLPAYPLPENTALSGLSWIRLLIPSLRAGLIVVTDSLLAGVALIAAFLIRFESDPSQYSSLIFCLPIIIVSYGVSALLHRNFRTSWKWFGIGDILWLSQTVLVSGLLSFSILWLFSITSYSRSVAVLYCFLCLAFSIAMRMSLRVLQDRLTAPKAGSQRIAVYGANSEGEMLASLFSKYPNLNVTPVLIVDRNLERQGVQIHGIPVRHCNSNLRDLFAAYRVSALVINGTSLAEEAYGNLREQCHDAGVSLLGLEISLRELGTVLTQSPLKVRAAGLE